MAEKEVITPVVQFVGLSALDPADRIKVKSIINKEFITLSRELKNIEGLKVHFKVYEKEGKKKYSVQMSIEAETGPITINKMSSNLRWDVADITHKMMEKARERIIHIFKTDTSYRKPYEKGVL